MGCQDGVTFHNILLLGKATFWSTVVLSFSMVLRVVSLCGSLCGMLLGGCVSARVLVDSLECCYRLDLSSLWSFPVIHLNTGTLRS